MTYLSQYTSKRGKVYNPEPLSLMGLELTKKEAQARIDDLNKTAIGYFTLVEGA
jgi:hypothetical protein